MERPKCPRCGADGYMAPKNTAQRAGTLLGGVIGVLGRLGCIISGPAGTVAALLAGAIAGQKLGQLFDDNVIRSYRCTKCGMKINL